MSDAQLFILLGMITTKLNNGIEKLEQELPNSFRKTYGGTHVFLDPVRVEIPVLKDLYELREDLETGLRQLVESTERGSNG